MTLWRNLKTGKRYRLLAFAVDATNSRLGASVIVYCPDDDGSIVYTRDHEEFMQKFEVVDGPAPVAPA